MKLFEYAVIYNPDDETEKSRIIVPLKSILAESVQSATLQAARDIPEDYVDKLDQCEVAVRPF